MKEDNDKLLDHEYDGIQELDNNLPTWWLWTFFITIIFSFLYGLHYDLSASGPTLDEELSQSMVEIKRNREKSESPEGQSTTETLETILVSGEKIYKNYCASCHNINGGGMVGPNLTDSYWIHGKGDEASIKNIVEGGVLEKGMPAWKEILKPGDVKAVTQFVLTFKGKNVAGGKDPQGQKVD